MNDDAPERSPSAEDIQKSLVRDISQMRRDLLALIIIAGSAGLVLIATVNPFILSLSPAAARTTRTNYMVLTPLLLLGVSLFFYRYLRPLKELASHLDIGRPPSPELAQRARRLALETPVYLLGIPIVGALGLSLLVVAVSSVHERGYIFAHQAPSAVLATTVTTGIALLVAMRARRILTPVLLATTDYAVEEDAGFRFDIRTRQRLISGILTSISIAFLAVLGYVVVYRTALEELQQRYILLSDVITQDFAVLGEGLRPWDEATLLAYLEQLSVKEGIFSTLVDAEGHYRSDIPPAFADLGLPPERLKEHLAPTTPTAFEVHDGAALLVPLIGTQRGLWLLFLYRAAPFKLASARRASIILLVFVIGMMAFVWVSSHYLSQDLSHDIRYVTQQFKQLATEAPSKAGDAMTVASTAHEIPVTSRDEVGDLVRAFNALQREIQMQQQQLAREQQDLLTLQTISTHISALRQLDQLLDAITTRVAEAFRGDNGRPRYTPLILLTDPGKKVLRLHGHSFTLPLGDEGGVLGNVAKTGQPAHIPDVAQDETYLVPDESQPMSFIHVRQSPPLPIARPIEVDALPTSALVMPMISSGEMIGVFSVETEGGFSACDERIITALANQTAVAIHNAQLYTALEEQRQTANGLVQMAQVINSTLELNQVLNLALESLGYLVPYDNASILLTERGKLQLVAQQGLDSSSHDRMPWQSPGLQRIGEEILETQQVRLIADMSALTHRQDVGAVPRSWVVAPLVVHGHSIGLLTVSKMEAFAYQAEASQRVAAFAEQVATAVQNARLYQTMLARAQELALLHEVSQRITGLLDVPLLLREITERVAEVFGYQVISIHLVDQEHASLTFAAQRGVDAGVVEDWQQALSGQGIVPWVARQRAPAVVPDVTSDPRYVPLREGIRSELAIPLIAGETLIGVFNVESEIPDAFDDSDMRLMTALGHQITAALENARLFESVQTQAHDLAHMAGALTEEKRKLDAILRNIADGLLVTDPQGAIIMVNPAFETMFGQLDALSTEQPGHEQALVHLIQQAVEQPIATLSTEIARRDGRTFKATAAAIQEDDGAPGETPASRLLGVVTVVRDISQEKAIERMKSDFVTTVSHELRTPLTSVLGFAKLIGRTFQKDILPRLQEDDRHIQRALRRIARNLDIMIVEGERLTHLLQDVLDISKMESGKVEWQDVKMDLMACIQEVVASYQGQAQEKGLRLEARAFGEREKGEEIRAKASLPLPRIVADRERIAQVLENLLSNAVKFTKTGGITVSARALAPGEEVHGWQATEEQGSGVLIAVEDTGPGIAVEDLPRLFHRFQQLVTDTLTDKPRGTGLGLAICKEIVEHYGGTIWAESTLDVGTTFYFTLPRQLKEPMTS